MVGPFPPSLGPQAAGTAAPWWLVQCPPPVQNNAVAVQRPRELGGQVMS